MGTQRLVQMGLRGIGCAAEDFDCVREQGFRVLRVEACWNQSVFALMAEIRQRMGERLVCLRFDADGLDSAYAPVSATVQAAGLTVPQGLEIIRGCKA